jgi:MFS family permease
MVRTAYTINFLDAFVIGIMTVAVPLMMLEYGIGVAAIGLVFALAPLAKILVRLAAAAAADSIGERAIYALSSLSGFVQPACYLFFPTTAGFSAGKIIDGAKESLTWSVNRSNLIATAPERKHYVLAGLVSGRMIYNAFGSLAFGALFVLGGFAPSLILACAISLAMLAYSLQVKNTHKHGSKPCLSDFSPFGRSRRFYESAGALGMGMSFYMTVLYFLAPIMFAAKGFGLGEIGMLYTGYFLLMGGTLTVLSHRKVGTEMAAGIGGLFMCGSLVAMAFAPPALLPLLFMAMAFGDAFLAMLWEEVNFAVGAKSSKRATDLALLATPGTLLGLVSIGLSGFVVQGWGFAPILAAGALSLALYAAWCVRLSKMGAECS